MTSIVVIADFLSNNQNHSVRDLSTLYPKNFLLVEFHRVFFCLLFRIIAELQVVSIRWIQSPNPFTIEYKCPGHAAFCFNTIKLKKNTTLLLRPYAQTVFKERILRCANLHNSRILPFFCHQT